MPDPTQEKFWRIKALKCYPQVYKMLMVGKPAPVIALYIQDERNEYTDVKLNSLATMLSEFRRAELGNGVLFDRMPHLVVSAAREFTDRLAELKELENLLDMQHARLDDAHGDVLMTGEKNPHIEKMEKALQDTIRLTHQIKMDLNLTGSRDLGTLTIAAEKMEELHQRYGQAGDKVFASPASRGRMLEAWNAATKVVREQQGDDGSPVIEIEPEPEKKVVEKPRKPRKAKKRPK